MQVLWMLGLLLAPLAQAHLKPAPASFVVTFSPGKHWNPKVSIARQPGLGEHITYVKKLYHEGKVVLGGSYTESSDSLLILTGKTAAEIQQVLESDPAIRRGTLSYQMRPLTVTMQRQHAH